MTQILSPAEQAAANRAKVMSTELYKACSEAIAGYMGNGCVSIIWRDEYHDQLRGVELLLSGWRFRRSDVFLEIGSDEDMVERRAQEREREQAGEAASKPTSPVSAPRVETPATPVKPKIDEGRRMSSMPKPETLVVAPSGSAAVRTFKVSNVTAGSGRSPATVPAVDVLNKLLNKAPDYYNKTPVVTKIEAHSFGEKTLCKPLGFHGLIETAHVAFAQHLGLELGPDDLWCTIMQGFARCVNMNPEAFRAKFVAHEGQKEILIIRNDFVLGSADNDWAGCLGQFSDAIRGFIGDEKHAHLISNFSTTQPIHRTVSEVALMDTMQSYFNFSTGTMCGIPFVTLRGTVEDWQQLAAKVRSLNNYGDLSWWLNDVTKIVDKFVAAAKGEVDTDFWRSLYKSCSTSGGIDITGWILRLLPFVKGYRDVPFERNPLLGERECTPHDPDRRSFHGEADLGSDETTGTGRLPSALSVVPFVWDYLGTKFDYQFIAGIVGYSQTGDTLKPEMGWAVRPKPAVAEAK